MTPRVFKYPVPIADEARILMPEWAQILSVAFQGPQLMLWAIVDPDAPKQVRVLAIRGTGHPAAGLDGTEPAAFVGTAIHPGGLVFHIWDRGEPDPPETVAGADAPDVWCDAIPPGGYVCGVCRTPTESEPCAEHQPNATTGGADR